MMRWGPSQADVLRWRRREGYRYEGTRVQNTWIGSPEDDNKPVLPRRCFFVTKDQRHNVKWGDDGTGNEVGKFKLKAPFREWLEYNMKDGFEVVRLTWGGRQGRFAIRLNSDRDAVIYKLFHE